jgi:hypothetical protein
VNFELVVARYNENLDWLSQVSHKYNITIYNKGEGDIGIKLLNVGRESDTYLTHIINNYDNLADITVFCQGNPFDHQADFINNINHEIFKLIKNNDFYNFCDTVPAEKKIANFPSWKLGHVNINMYEFVKKLYDNSYDKSYEDTDMITYGSGAQFFVNKNKILKHSKAFYLNAKKLVDYSINPAEGYCFERSWHYIFK